MEGFRGSGFGGVNAVSKKRRSATLRRPRPDSHLVSEDRDMSPPSSTPSSDNASKHYFNGNAGYDASSRKKELNLNTPAQVSSSFNRTEGLSAPRKIKKDDKKYEKLDTFYGKESFKGGRKGSDLKKHSSVMAPANLKSEGKFKEQSKVRSASPDRYVAKGGEGRRTSQLMGSLNESAENKQRKVKLELSGVTRTIHTKLDNDNGGTSSAKPSHSSDAPRHRQKLILQASSDDDDDTPAEKENDLQGVSGKGFTGGRRFSHGANEVSQGKAKDQSLHGEQTDKPSMYSSSETVRKSKRVPKRRVLDSAFDDGNRDDEIHHLKRLKSYKASMDHKVEYEDKEDDLVKKKKLSNVSKSKKSGYHVDKDYGLSHSVYDSRKKPGTGRESDETEYIDEEELGSDDGSHADRMQHKGFLDPSADSKMEPLTTRQRALQSGKGAGGTSIEFPDGLPPVNPRKQKEKLSEVEQQARKAEAAQRRRLQVEKQAKELEAETIRKILGQESSRKKKEDKEQKERDEKAQKRAAESLVLASSTIRWVMGPTGTVVTFADDIGLPSIFGSEPCSYPPPREKCAGPSCTNAYKYRDSKLNLPLCSLQCYKAVREKSRTVSTC